MRSWWEVTAIIVVNLEKIGQYTVSVIENFVRSLWEVTDIIVVNLEKIGQYTVSVIENSVRSLWEVTDIIVVNLEKIGQYTVSVIEKSVRSLWEVTDIIVVNLEKIGQYTVSVIENFLWNLSKRLKISQWLTIHKFRPLMHMPPQLYSPGIFLPFWSGGQGPVEFWGEKHLDHQNWENWMQSKRTGLPF